MAAERAGTAPARLRSIFAAYCDSLRLLGQGRAARGVLKDVRLTLALPASQYAAGSPGRQGRRSAPVSYKATNAVGARVLPRPVSGKLGTASLPAGRRGPRPMTHHDDHPAWSDDEARRARCSCASRSSPADARLIGAVRRPASAHRKSRGASSRMSQLLDVRPAASSSGVDVCRALTDEPAPAGPVILITGNADSDDIEACGAAVIAKPFRERSLWRRWILRSSGTGVAAVS